VRRACIDIGSNTTRLLVADASDDGGLVPHHEERAFTRIGSALDEHGAIPEHKLDEVAAAVARQLASARSHGAEQIVCVATAGVRRAVNGDELVERVTAVCDGIEIRVLTGEEEARGAFVGATWALGDEAAGRKLAVVDVGGGSTEMAAGSAPDTVDWWVSLPLGSAEIGRFELHSDPPHREELECARERIDAAFAALTPPETDLVIAVGGSATSLRMLAGGKLDQRAFQRALTTLQGFPAAVVSAHSQIDVARVRLLPAGILILEAISKLFDSPLQIGRAGLREGLLLTA